MLQPSVAGNPRGGRPLVELLRDKRPIFWLCLAVWLLAVAVLTRASVLLDWAYFNDETFYLLAAQRMHNGAWLYAEVWDRKGPGLFAIYWLATALSPTLLACRLVALVFATATAMVMARIALHWTGLMGAALTGTLYLACLPMFVGAGAQPQVFYNLFVALAVLLVLRVGEEYCTPWQALAAMALMGLALTFKQTVLCEGLFLAGWTLWWQWRGGRSGWAMVRLTAMMAAAGAAPMAAAMAIFTVSGRFYVFWYAMVTSNLVKHYDPWGDHWARIHALAVAASPVLVLATVGLILGPMRDAQQPRKRIFLIGWLVAAVLGVLIIPNLYADYMLPLMVPLCVCAGLTMGRGPLGLAGAGIALLIYLLSTSALDFAGRRAASAQIEILAGHINVRQPHARLLVYEGPLALYALGSQAPPSPLLDNFHLNFPFENNTSYLNTEREMQRILAWHPQVVVLYHGYAAQFENPHTAPLVRAYIRSCRLWERVPYREVASDQLLDVYGDCLGPMKRAISGPPFR